MLCGGFGKVAWCSMGIVIVDGHVVMVVVHKEGSLLICDALPNTCRGPSVVLEDVVSEMGFQGQFTQTFEGNYLRECYKQLKIGFALGYMSCWCVNAHGDNDDDPTAADDDDDGDCTWHFLKFRIKR